MLVPFWNHQTTPIRAKKGTFILYRLKILVFHLFLRIGDIGWLVNRTGAIVLDFKIG